MAEYQPTAFEGKVQGREFLGGGDDSGMGLTGKWMNKRTGKQINIRQTIQDGDNMIIISDKGQIPMDVFSREYIQVSDDIYDESGKIIGTEQATSGDVGSIEEYEKMYGVDPLIPEQSPQQQQFVNNESIIKKVFDKISSKPTIDIDIKWDNFPEAQINTLVDFLDVDIKDISAYIIKNYVNIESLSVELTDMLNIKLHRENDIKDKKNIEEETNE